jgi:hypothetical protein
MRQPINWTRPVPAITAVDTGRADSLFRLAAAWRACPKDRSEAHERPEAPVSPLFTPAAGSDILTVRAAARRQTTRRPR